jgi:hypothetical protein
MRVNVNEIVPIKKEKLVYNERTGNRIDVEVYLNPLRAMYKVGKEGGEDANLFGNLSAAIEKFNSLESEG